MALLTTDAGGRAELTTRLATPDHVVAVALCAAWCTTCREFRAACERIAQAHREISFVWIDIEDDAELIGDLDIETFPTVAIFEGEALRHFGVVLPKAELLERLVTDLDSLRHTDAPDEVAGLVAALRC